MTYTYKGTNYTLLGEAQMKIYGHWLPCVIYQDATGKMYVRAKDEFFEKFKKIEE